MKQNKLTMALLRENGNFTKDSLAENLAMLEKLEKGRIRMRRAGVVAIVFWILTVLWVAGGGLLAAMLDGPETSATVETVYIVGLLTCGAVAVVSTVSLLLRWLMVSSREGLLRIQQLRLTMVQMMEKREKEGNG